MARTIFDFLLYLSMLIIISVFFGKVSMDQNKIEKLNKIVHNQQVDNDNLQYQLNQCKILYRGI